jgi:hypothetical protein
LPTLHLNLCEQFGIDSLTEIDFLRFSRIFYAYSDSVHEVKSGEATFFSAPSLLVHFRESLHRISKDSLLSKNLFGRASPQFSLEAHRESLPESPAKLPLKLL